MTVPEIVESKKGEYMFKIQMHVPGIGWTNINEDAKSRIPENEDALIYLRRCFPVSDFRVVKQHNILDPERYHCGNDETKPGDETTVYGWYDEQKWEKVRFVRKTSLGWLVERVM